MDRVRAMTVPCVSFVRLGVAPSTPECARPARHSIFSAMNRSRLRSRAWLRKFCLPRAVPAPQASEYFECINHQSTR
jgi:hypothetical protein